MNTENYMQKEHRALVKLIHFRLPEKFMTIGLLLSILSFGMLVFRENLFESDSLVIKDTFQKALLIGMLVMSISRDKVEDEMTVQLRMQSYAWAFITGVIYALVMPYVEFGVGSALNGEDEVYKSLGDFQVLVFMLLVQLMCYHVLKRFR